MHDPNHLPPEHVHGPGCAHDHEPDHHHVTDPVRNPLRKVGRNDLCPCGSGQKFKKCHGSGAAEKVGAIDYATRRMT